MSQQDDQTTPLRSPTGVAEHLARHGGITYLHLPATDIQQSADFYERVFGWTVQLRDREHASFQDTTGRLLGAWVTDLAIAREPGVLPYIYVDRIGEALEQVVAHGGEVARAPYREGSLWVATFRDPAGNVLGLWQDGAR